MSHSGPHNNQLVHYEDTHGALDTYIIIAQKQLEEQTTEILGSGSFTRWLGTESNVSPLPLSAKSSNEFDNSS